MSETRPALIEFGQELIKARQGKGMTLEQMADLTRIQVRYLKSIEAGEWEILPQPYMEAFIKAYAETVGLNLPKIIRRYRDLLKSEFPPSPQELDRTDASPEPPAQETSKVIKSSNKWLIITLATLGMLLIGVVGWWFYFRPEETVEPQPSLTYERVVPQPDTLPPKFAATSVDSDSTKYLDSTGVLRVIPDSLVQPEAALPLGMNLFVKASASCWVRATLDRKKIKEVLLRTGDSLIWEATDEIQLVVGNAGGLQLTLDGEPLGSLGPEGKAVTLTISPEGIQSQRLGKERLPKSVVPVIADSITSEPNP